MRYFAVSDNRESKAKKIEAVLCDFLAEDSIEAKKILDLGCGSGHIAEFFSRANEVIAADVVNQMTVEKRDTFTFTKIDTVLLPFKDDYFDIVIFNHVLYCAAHQLGQLTEIYRVLRPGGICYFASANRYFPIEGFTRLPLLHYLPGSLFRALYKRILKTDEDLFPMGYHKMIDLIGKAGFTKREYTAEIIDNPEKYHSEHAVPFRLPVPKCISPTIIFVLRK
jgi:ubiquinone/menaquinone biosynthesis C-methylase UbiE